MMINKQSLQHEFPNFDIHEAKFSQTQFYMLVKDQIHFHIDVEHDTGIASVLVYVEGDRIMEKIAQDNALKELYNELRTLTKDYDNTRT